jgi:NAD(P)-dependent dehydrogenase (short-subunit alcohol dehydrogenase family)
MRLRDKIAIVVGAGQSPGEGLGNGRATVLRFAQEGAKVLAVDNNLSSAEETVAMARQSDGDCTAFEADVTKEATLAAMVETAQMRWGRVDVLHYNVGISIAGGDAPLDEITEAAFDRITTVNLRGAIMACKHILPLMRTQRAGVNDFIGRRLGAVSECRLQSDQGWNDRVHSANRCSECGIWSACQCHLTGIDGYTDGS